jgi:hypothetical protein
MSAGESLKILPLKLNTFITPFAPPTYTLLHASAYIPPVYNAKPFILRYPKAVPTVAPVDLL